MIMLSFSFSHENIVYIVVALTLFALKSYCNTSPLVDYGTCV